MPLAPIPFLDAQESGLEELGGASPLAMNVVIDGRGVAQRRPGVVADSSILPTGVVDSAGIDHLHVAQNGKTYAAGGLSASRRALYELVPGGAIGLSSSTDAETFVRGTRGKPTLAETAALLVYAAGTFPTKLTLSTNATAALGGPPPEMTHITANFAYLLGDDLAQSGIFRYSEQAAGGATAGHETWPAVNFIGADARPDEIVAMSENTNEVFVFGRTNVQVFVPDDVLTFAPMATREYGCIAPYSVIKRDQRFIWLDHKKRFVASDGRSFEVISTPIEKTLDDIQTVDDCFGYWVQEGVANVLVWTFPTDGRTFVFQEGLWGQWSGWNDASNNWSALPISAHHQSVLSGDNVVGTTDGKVGRLTFDSQTDLGQRINAYVQTGFLNRETERLKHCEAIFVTLRRGETTGTDALELFISFRDKPGEWQRLTLNLGQSGETEPVIELRSLGTYRRRQWRFEFSEDQDLKLVKVEEQYQVMET